MKVAARGVPDWQGSFVDGAASFVLLPACADPALYFALPRLASLAQRSDGSPDVSLEFVSDRNGAGPENSLYASLHLGLQRGGSLEDAHRLVAERSPGAALMPAALTTGTVWHLECEMAALLPRIETTVTFETARLLDALRALGTGGASVPFRIA